MIGDAAAATPVFGERVRRRGHATRRPAGKALGLPDRIHRERSHTR